MRRDQGKRPRRAIMVVIGDEVPVDILIDILARLPLKSLVRFRCVSKPWCRLITRPSLTRKRQLMNRAAADSAGNQDHQQQKKQILVSKWPSSVCLYSFEKRGGTLIDFQFPFPRNKVLIGGYCDSLVCVKSKDQDIKHLALWNISTGEYRTIPFMSSVDIPTNIFETLGLGYDFTADDLKIVRVLSGDSSISSLVQVFSLKSNSWRTSNQSSCYFRSANNLRPMVHLDGNLYGQGHYCFNGENSIEGIVRFDLAIERFGDAVPSPPAGPGTKDVCLGVLGGCLVATIQFENHSTLWVLQKSAGGVGETWVKRFTNNSGSIMRPICFTDDGVGLVLADADAGFVECKENSSASFNISRERTLYYPSRSLGKNMDGAFEIVESLVSPHNNF